MTNKKGSTLLLALCLFFVFLIFAGALLPLAQRAFKNTAADVTQQQAEYIAQSTLEALISQLDNEALQKTLIDVVKGTKNQVESEWASYGDYGEYRYVITLDPFIDTHHWFSWVKKKLYITSESRYEGKTSTLTAAVQSTRFDNLFFDPIGIEKEFLGDQARAKRAVFINECRVPTEASADFWINAISDLSVTQENVNGQISEGKTDSSYPNEFVDEKVVLIYRNIKNPVVTGNIDGNVLLEPAEYTKATIGGNEIGQVVINGDVICKGDLILKNARINGAIYYSGNLTNIGSSYTGETYQVNNDHEIFSYYELNLPVIPAPLKVLEYENNNSYDEENVDVILDDSKVLIFNCINPQLNSLHIKSGKYRTAAYLNLTKMPNDLVIESDNKRFRPIIIIDDENPVLSDQISTNLLSSENIILVFTHPVRIQGDLNVSVFAPKIIFEAEGVTVNGQIQACEFVNSELVNSINLRARNSDNMYFITKLNSTESYYFDLLYYQK